MTSWLIRLRYVLALLAVLLLGAAVLLEKRHQVNQLTATRELANGISEKMLNKEQQARILLANEPLLQRIYNGHFDPAVARMAEIRNLKLLAYRNDTLIYWSSSEIQLDSAEAFGNPGKFVVKLNNGWYQGLRQQKGIYTLLCLYLVKHEYPFENQYLDNKLNPDLGSRLAVNITLNSVIGQNSEAVLDSDGQSLFYITIKGSDYLPRKIWMLYGLGIFLFILTLHSWFTWLRRNRYFWSGFVLLLIGVLGIRFALYFRLILLPIYQLEIFRPDVYASSFLLPSIGDFFLHVIAIGILVSIYYLHGPHRNLLARFKLTAYLQVSIQFALAGFLFFYTDMMFTLVKGLVIDSHISFDITNLSSLSAYTYFSLAAIGFMFMIHYMLMRMLITHFYQSLPGFSGFLLFLVTAGGYILFQVFDGKQVITGMVFVIVYNACFFYLYPYYLNFNYIQRWMVSLLVLSIFSALLINYHVVNKEREYRKLFAPKMTSRNDVDAEYLFLDIERKIEQDKFIFDYFTDRDISKRYFERRVKQLYFSGYLNKYELLLLDYDTSGYSIGDYVPYSYAFINNVYNTQSYRTISNNFLNIRGAGPVNLDGYLAKFEMCTPETKHGYLFILLRPKFIQGENIYPELFSINQRRAERNPYNYSYALYKYNRLMNQSGDFAYTMVNEFMSMAKPGDFFRYKGYSHYLFADNSGTSVLVSRKENTLLQTVTYLSFLTVFYTLLALSIILLLSLNVVVRMLWAYMRNDRRVIVLGYSRLARIIPFLRRKGLYMSTKIQMAMITVLFAGLFLTAYFSVSYLNFKYGLRESEKLLEKVREVVNELENENRIEMRLNAEDDRLATVNQISDSYKADINLFATDGTLLATTKPRIFSAGLEAPIINPEAMYNLRTLQGSQYIHTECIGSLEFLSAYMPMLGNNNQPIAYINLPYFTPKNDLEKEISSFVLTFINLYALFFVIVGWLAYFISKRISAPLFLIREKISKTKLEERNEIIEWQQQDELGQLVKQYNKMLVELERSANKLAETEREGAWREMAKQVAHEIKNPLTPMKLSVQHLQRAWQDRKPNIEDTFNRVTAVLIEQIDSLSNLATQFSSFAKMPVSQFEPVPVKEVMEAVYDLYKDTSHVQLELEVPAGECWVYADRDQLMRVFNNLVKNAIQAIPEDREGKIIMHLEQQDDRVIITVADNGKGIPEDQHQRIFSPNFSTKTSGMGLGLAISRKIIEHAGGTISFRTQPNTGTEFFVNLPVYSG